MESRIKVLGHPTHQILVVLPLGAFGVSFTNDLLHTFFSQRKHELVATQALDFALVSAAVAAPFGLIDWLAIPTGTRARRVGMWHALGNGALLGLLGASRWLRSRRGGLASAKWVSGAGFMLSGLTAWLGGELVNRHGVGVSDTLGLDVSSSLAERRALRRGGLGAVRVRSDEREPMPR